MYDNGHGVPQDYAAAVSWYRKAAEQGDADAQYNLGVMYDAGQGVPQDYAAAVSWYRKAAEQGYAGAQYNLGVMYERGSRRAAGLRGGGVVVSQGSRPGPCQGPAQPRRHVRPAAEACRRTTYRRTSGSTSRAHATMRPTRQSRDSAVRNRDIVAAKMTPAQIAEAQKLAREWKPKPDGSRQ